MKDSKEMYIFLAKAAVMYLIYQGLDAWVMPTNGVIKHAISFGIASVSAAVLGLFGYNAHAETVQVQYNGIFLNGKVVVWIEDGCNGLVLMALFAGFVIAYPGPWKKKLWYVPAGLALVYVCNIIRCVALALLNQMVNNAKLSKSTFDFNHKYLFTTILYLIIFGLWMLWANKFARINELDNEDNTLSVA